MAIAAFVIALISLFSCLLNFIFICGIAKKISIENELLKELTEEISKAL